MTPAPATSSTVLTDDPDLVRSLFGSAPAGAGPEPVPGARPWWEVLGGGEAPAAVAVPAVLPGWAGRAPVALVRGRSAGSQYRAVRDHLTAGGALESPLVCLAGEGDRFEGQSGRRWRALPGNIHLTLAWPCDLPAGPVAVALTALPAVAVRAALRALRPGGSGSRPGIKWVNDVLVGDDKVSGVLSAIRTQADRVAAVVYGIGLNVETAPDLPPSAFTPSAGCLRDAWGPAAPVRERVLRTLLAELVAWQRVVAEQGPGPVLAAYGAGSVLTGRRVGIWPAGTPDAAPGDLGPPDREGVVAGIAADLSLELAGDPAPVRSGRLALLDRA